MARIFGARDANPGAAGGFKEGDDTSEVKARGGWVSDVG